MGYSGSKPRPVVAGSTGDASFTAYAPICGGTTSTGSLQVASTGFSTSGNVLTSNGSSSLPSWQAAASGGGLTLIETVTPDGTNFWANFTNAALVNYSNLLFIFTGIKPIGNHSYLTFGYSSDGGSSFTNPGAIGVTSFNGTTVTGYNNAGQIGIEVNPSSPGPAIGMQLWVSNPTETGGSFVELYGQGAAQDATTSQITSYVVYGQYDRGGVNAYQFFSIHTTTGGDGLAGQGTISCYGIN